jgi:hypothetical protein
MDSPGSLPAWKWTGAQTLDFVHALNERYLQVLGRQVAEEGRIFPASETFEMVTACQKLWVELEGSARCRAAKCPFLLIEMRFQNEKWWPYGAPLFSRPHSPALSLIPPTSSAPNPI